MYIFASALIKLPDTDNIRGRGEVVKKILPPPINLLKIQKTREEIRKYNKINGPSSCDHDGPNLPIGIG